MVSIEDSPRASSILLLEGIDLIIVDCISSSAGVPNICLIRLRQQGDSNFEFRMGYFVKWILSECMNQANRGSNQDHVRCQKARPYVSRHEGKVQQPSNVANHR